MPRYAILFHETPPDGEREPHFDLLLEAEGVLRTWALPAELDREPEQTALELADHRLAYLDYEGPVSGGRGVVTRWDQGEFAWLEARSDCICVHLCGRRLVGELRLERANLDDLPQTDQRWRVRFAPAAAEAAAPMPE